MNAPQSLQDNGISDPVEASVRCRDSAVAKVLISVWGKSGKTPKGGWLKQVLKDDRLFWMHK